MQLSRFSRGLFSSGSTAALLAIACGVSASAQNSAKSVVPDAQVQANVLKSLTGAPDLVDADNERLEIPNQLMRPEVQDQQSHRNHRNQCKRNLEVGVGHQGIAKLGEEELLGFVKVLSLRHEGVTSA